ncbi:15275_t:CDS:2, partial [Racocetra persica]
MNDTFKETSLGPSLDSRQHESIRSYYTPFPAMYPSWESFATQKTQQRTYPNK